MNTFSAISILAVAAAALCTTASSFGKVNHLRAYMDGAQANNGNGTGSDGTGLARVTYDDVTNELTWNVSWENLSGTPNNQHFHGPAAPGVGAGVVQGIGFASNPEIGSATITPAEGTDLLAGLWYVNLHTTVDGGGEIRGQVEPCDLDDDFSDGLANWTATTRGLENNAPAGYDAADTTGDQVTLGGTTTSQFWYGNSLESVANFDSRLNTEISVTRVSMIGSGSAYRSSLWILGDDSHYMHYSQNVGETGWSWNASDAGGAGTLAPTGGGNNIVSLDAIDTDGGQFEMGIRMVPGNAGTVDVTLVHDGADVATHQFTNFPANFKVILTGQARAGTDTVSAVFDNLVVCQQPPAENLPPTFSSNNLNLPDGTVGTPYSEDISAEASDAEDDPLTFSKISGPTWVSVSGAGVLSGTPAVGDAGVNQVVVEVSDGNGANETTATIRVIDPNANPSGELFGWWPLNEGAGDIAVDISGNGRDAVIVRVDTGGLGEDGAAWREDPECGPVLSFNGDDATGSYAIMSNGIPGEYGALPLFTNDAESTFTWCLWVNAEDNQANNDIILGNRYQPGGGDFAPREFIKFDSNNFEFDTNNVQGVDYADIVGDQLGKWVHHAIVKDAGIFTYYRDGVEAGTGTAAGPQNNPMPLFFGGQGNFDGSVTNELWRGSLFDVRLFTGALSADDVFAVFTAKGVFTGQEKIKFTDIDASDAANGNVSVTWTSKDGGSYKVERSTDLENWVELDDGFPSQGELTTREDNFVPLGSTRIFYRVTEN